MFLLLLSNPSSKKHKFSQEINQKDSDKTLGFSKLHRNQSKSQTFFLSLRESKEIFLANLETNKLDVGRKKKIKTELKMTMNRCWWLWHYCDLLIYKLKIWFFFFLGITKRKNWFFFFLASLSSQLKANVLNPMPGQPIIFHHVIVIFLWIEESVILLCTLTNHDHGLIKLIK